MRIGRASSAANITSMPQTAHEERAARMRNYAIVMCIRTACFLALIWVRGPWMLLFAVGAIFLPYFAVVVANHMRRRGPDEVARPAAIVLVEPPLADDAGFAGAHAAGAAHGSGSARDWEAA